jgi:hypothetical protein
MTTTNINSFLKEVRVSISSTPAYTMARNQMISNQMNLQQIDTRLYKHLIAKTREILSKKITKYTNIEREFLEETIRTLLDESTCSFINISLAINQVWKTNLRKSFWSIKEQQILKNTLIIKDYHQYEFEKVVGFISQRNHLENCIIQFSKINRLIELLPLSEQSFEKSCTIAIILLESLEDYTNIKAIYVEICNIIFQRAIVITDLVGS